MRSEGCAGQPSASTRALKALTMGPEVRAVTALWEGKGGGRDVEMRDQEVPAVEHSRRGQRVRLSQASERE